MNLLLLEPDAVDEEGHARIEGRQADHVRSVLRKHPGDTLRAGVVDGPTGVAIIVGEDERGYDLACTLDVPPAPVIPRIVVLALPRPPVLRRLLAHLASMAVQSIVLLHTARVDKSYWHTPSLRPQSVGAQLRLGLEQGGHTRLPRVELRRRFAPFVHDELPSLLHGARGLVADPQATTICPTDVHAPVVMAVGPEGGFVLDELDRLRAAGLEAVHLGPRILRVEVAVVAMLARLGWT